MDAKELLARESIRHTIASYCFYMDGGQIDKLLGLFTENGIFEIYGRCATGAGDILKLLGASGAAARTFGRKLRVHHVTGTPMIEMVSPDSAIVQTYVTVFTNEGLDHWGVYRDELGVVGDRWLLRRRSIKVLGATVGGLGEYLSKNMLAVE